MNKQEVQKRIENAEAELAKAKAELIKLETKKTYGGICNIDYTGRAVFVQVTPELQKWVSRQPIGEYIYVDRNGYVTHGCKDAANYDHMSNVESL